ncbi:MAG: 1-deoxy-D-xylulose-5-phosphate reductoisomerase [Planctomycetes bacterium]|nr:1-deoxy-D-xylulose-5-phosphate reductoisomerase [Planctomycetota bacterium]
MHKRVVILGSTGSIGQSALDVVAAMEGAIEVVGLAAGRNGERLAEQAARVRCPAVAIQDQSHAAALQRRVGAKTRVLSGDAGLVDLVAESGADFVLAAIVGAAGLRPMLAAVEHGMDVGLANKESLVVAGSILMPLVRKTGCKLIPVDSEHSAIFQAMHSGRGDEVRKLHLTASGGPFRTWPRERIEHATLDEALKHPNWVMGPKITIDSATMMNKALEVIEASWLFEMPADRIEVLVHPESIVHSMVEFIDGSVIAQLGTPDMKTPIQYALTFPRRVAGIAEPLDWSQSRTLHFEPPDLERFPALKLGFDAARAGGTAGAVLNAANESAVERFRAGRVRFGCIAGLAAEVCRRHRPLANPTLEQLLDADAWARAEVDACMS